MGRTITPQCPVNPEEHILRQVLGFRSVSGEPVANIKHAPGVSAHKFLPGRPVALEALLDQLGVLLQRIVSLIACYGARRASESATLSMASWQSISACQLWNANCPRNVPARLGPYSDRPLCSASYSAIHLETRKSSIGAGLPRHELHACSFDLEWLASSLSARCSPELHSLEM